MRLGANPIQQKICFIHIPRCGGTSLISAIRKARGLRAQFRDPRALYTDATASQSAADALGRFMPEYREELLFYFLSSTQYNFVAGHFRCSEAVTKTFAENWNFITLLRHPVDRWFSQYFYNRYKRSTHFKIDQSIDEYLESEIGRGAGHQYMRLLTSGDAQKDYTSEAAISEALQNLRTFRIVGIQEELTQFAQEFENAFGVRLDIARENASPLPKDQRQSLVTQEVRTRVEEICRPDIELYQRIIRVRDLVG